jgi:NAD(P)H dehydrogenase (quinone)
MPKILVLYDTLTGNTRAMAQAVAEGAGRVAGLTVALKPVEEADKQDLLDSGGLAVGTPTWCGLLSWRLKRFFDENTQGLWGKVEGKVACAFSTCGGQGGGNEIACQSLLSVLLNFGYLVFGVCDYVAPGMTLHYGAVAVGKPDERELAACRRLGEKLAAHVARLGAG